MDATVLATLAGVALGLFACVATCVVCRIWRRNRYYRKVQRNLDEEEAAFQECVRAQQRTQRRSSSTNDTHLAHSTLHR